MAAAVAAALTADVPACSANTAPEGLTSTMTGYSMAATGKTAVEIASLTRRQQRGLQMSQK